MELFRLGFPREDAVVLGIALAGASVQFCAVYLIEESFPGFVTLSPELSPFGTFREMQIIAEWCLRFVAFADHTVDKFHSKGSIKARASVRLSLANYFLKPIRNTLKALQNDENYVSLFSSKNMRLNYTMRLYEKIWKADHTSSNFILFPEGVVSVPGEDVKDSMKLRNLLITICEKDGFTGMEWSFRPLLLFPRLRSEDGWSTEKPPRTLVNSYLICLSSAIDVLNRAGVAHLDLRPANIMWRKAEPPSIDMRIIDFEDAVAFGEVISEQIVSKVIETQDRRYPFRRR